MEFVEKRVKHFINLALERHKIYVLKEKYKAKKPWTQDPIFLKYRFCNVFRRLDKVTDYIVKTVIKPNETNPRLWEYIIISRYFSKLQTIGLITDLIEKCHYTYSKVIEVLYILYKKKQVLTTSAFILNPLKDGRPKFLTPFIIIEELKRDLEHMGGFDRWVKEDVYEIETMVNCFKTCTATAGFMAYEYATDFVYSKRYFKDLPLDYYTYGNFTIGSLRGLKRLLGLSPKDKTKLPIKELTIELLSLWQIYINKNIIINEDTHAFHDLSMREVEHWLCEYDKYMRIYNGEATRLKRRYNGNKD